MASIRDPRSPRFVTALCVGLAIVSCSGGDGGGGGGTPGETLPPTHPGARIIFVTSTVDDGNLLGWMSQCSGRSTGLEAADCVCQEHARIWGNLSGTYKAWLSDSRTPASARLAHSSVPYVNRRGEVIAASWAGLADALCTSLMQQDERGEWFSPTNIVWTGTDSSGGARGPGKYCEDWTSGLSRHGGWVGSAGVDAYWPNFAGCWSEWVSSGGWDDCDGWNHLYCVEQ